MLDLIKAKLLEMDTATIDSDLVTTEETADITSAEAHPDPASRPNETTKDSSANAKGK